MLPLNRLALGSALFAGALALSPQAALQNSDRPGTHEQYFPTPAQGMVIGEDKDQTLEQVLRDFERVSGERLLISEESRVLLAMSKLQLPSPLQVAPKNVYGVVQSLLHQGRFAITSLRREEPRMLSVASLDSSSRASIKAAAMFVPQEQLEDYALDSALLVQTALHLPHLDIRSLGNAVRQLVVDPNTMQIIPVPESNQVIVTGFGSQLHELSSLLYALDAGGERSQQTVVNEALLQAAQRLGLDEE